MKRKFLKVCDAPPQGGAAWAACRSYLTGTRAHSRRGLRMRATIACLLLCLLPQIAMPQQATKQVDEEEQMDSALRKFGYVSGQAFSVREAKGRANEVRAQIVGYRQWHSPAIRVGSRVNYAAAYGAGLADQMDQKKCPEATKQHTEMLAKLKILAAR